MSNLEKYYDARVLSLEENEFLKQVGHTETGGSISTDQFTDMVQQLHDLLELEAHDVLLDLCCGNGVITVQLATKAETAVGVDISDKMVEIANTHHKAAHIKYFHQDIMKLSLNDNIRNLKFSKVVMHGALQHFKPSEFEKLLEVILSVTTQRPTIVFGFVPEHGKQNKFYYSLKRRIEGYIRRAIGRDFFGNWWDKSFITEVCYNLDLDCSFHNVGESLVASTYRFNLKIVRTDDENKAG